MQHTHLTRTGSSLLVQKGENTWLIDADWEVDIAGLENLPRSGTGIYNGMLVAIRNSDGTTTLHPEAVHDEHTLDIERAISAIDVATHNLGERHAASIRENNSVSLQFDSGKIARVHTWETLTQIETGNENPDRGQ